MNRTITRVVLAATVASLTLAQALAQTAAPAALPETGPTLTGQAPLSDLIHSAGAPTYDTAGADPQHTNWTPLDQWIRPGNMSQFKQWWSTTPNSDWQQSPGTNAPVGGRSYSPGVLLQSIGVGEALIFLGGSGNNAVGLDTDTGKQYWYDDFTNPKPSIAPNIETAIGKAPAAANPTVDCPGATAVAPTRLSPLVIPAATPVANRAATQPAGSAVGAPGEGLPAAFVTANMRAPRAAAAPAAGGAAPAAGFAGATPAAGAAGAAPAAGAAGRGAAAGNTAYLNLITNDGNLHFLGPDSGKDILAPAPFLPANAQPADLILVGATLYASTVHGCNGHPDGLYAMNVNTMTVSKWMAGGGALSGPPSFDAAGTAYVAVGNGSGGTTNAIVALDPATLAVKATMKAAGADFVGPPTIFASGGKTIVAAATSDGRIFLFDAAGSGSPLASTAASARSGFKPAGLGTWVDETGQRFVNIATASSVVSYKVTSGGTGLTQAFVVSGLTAPLTPVVASGVLFAVSSGQYVPAAGQTATPAQMVSGGKPGRVYAVDAKTGQALWNSGDALKSWISPGSVTISAGNIIVATYDNRITQFGMGMEREAP